MRYVTARTKKREKEGCRWINQGAITKQICRAAVQPKGCAADSLPAPIVGADEKVLICFKSVCRAVVQLCSIVCTEYLSRKDTDPAGFT